MKKIKLTVLSCALILISCPVFATEKPEWFVCKEDADCVGLHEECSTHAVNKKFQTEAHDYYSAIDALKSCLRTVGVEDFQVFCKNMKCVASPKQAIEK